MCEGKNINFSNFQFKYVKCYIKNEVMHWNYLNKFIDLFNLHETFYVLFLLRIRFQFYKSAKKGLDSQPIIYGG